MSPPYDPLRRKLKETKISSNDKVEELAGEI